LLAYLTEKRKYNFLSLIQTVENLLGKVGYAEMAPRSFLNFILKLRARMNTGTLLYQCCGSGFGIRCFFSLDPG
jgi:hypothetical protein